MVRRKQLYFVCYLVEFILGEFYPEEIALLVKPTDLYLSEVGVLRICWANRHDLAQKVWHVMLLKKAAHVTHLENLVPILELRINFLCSWFSLSLFFRDWSCCGCGFFPCGLLNNIILLHFLTVFTFVCCPLNRLGLLRLHLRYLFHSLSLSFLLNDLLQLNFRC